ncbi:polysaccharide biosynthesis tyrosine autokinase [Mycobacterium sp. ITM-2016-00317]|uniref:polysaccharide biosynthesis tyrosine autokinase n=1 Tax=Mycobacterium sp. ITM-2016-00317 TaxID=2099694 RepID=UPI000D460E66|nr:polysaccharide biosynthesis tyrosine autokinase [Mycobacterium sp. ITM-2016-00317]WNG87011.1 polysaccharide biosynthesis tyrosine autokinase [Mycobacterium sp. ITM-2016-00317]
MRESLSGEGSQLTVQDFARILRTRWRIICATTGIAIIGAFAYSLFMAPSYQASTRLFVATAADGTNSEIYDGSLFAERRVLSYIELLAGDILAQRTIDKLGLDMSVSELQDQIEASAPTETVVIDVAVSDRSAARARDIANALSDEFVIMAAELETPTLGAQPNARVIVQQRADIPDSSTAPNTARTMAVTALLGAIIGIIIALVRGRSDHSVRSPSTLEEAAGVGLLVEIPFEAKLRENPLISFQSDSSPSAEAFRELRVNLKFLEVAEGSRVLTVTSAMPEEGRTSTAINLALSLAESGHNVIVVDGDMRRPRVARYLDLSGKNGLSNVLRGEVAVRDALQQTSSTRLTALTSGPIPPSPTELLESPATTDVLNELSAQFDYVVVDTPSLLKPDGAILAAASQGVLMLARFGTTRRGDLVRGCSSLNRAGAPLVGTVLTMTPAKRSRGRAYYSSSEDSQPLPQVPTEHGPRRSRGN